MSGPDPSAVGTVVRSMRDRKCFATASDSLEGKMKMISDIDACAAPPRLTVVHLWLSIAIRSWLRVVIFAHIFVWSCLLVADVVVHLRPRRPATSEW